MSSRKQTRCVGIALGALLLGANGSLPAAHPVLPAPPPATPAQIIHILEVLPQGGTREGVPASIVAPTLCEMDQEFVRKALAVIMTEIQMAKLTGELANTAELRTLSNELLIAQTKNGAALREAARMKSCECEWKLSPEQEKLITSFRMQAPEAIAPAFHEWVQTDRSGAIPVFIQAAKMVKDPLLQTLAEQILGELRTERPAAAAAIAAKAAQERAPIVIAEEPRKENAPAASPPPGKGSIGRQPGKTAAKGQASASKASTVARSARVKGNGVDTIGNGTPVPSSSASNAERSFRTERDANGQIKMSPMISSDVAEGREGATFVSPQE